MLKLFAVFYFLVAAFNLFVSGILFSVNVAIVVPFTEMAKLSWGLMNAVPINLASEIPPRMVYLLQDMQVNLLLGVLAILLFIAHHWPRPWLYKATCVYMLLFPAILFIEVSYGIAEYDVSISYLAVNLRLYIELALTLLLAVVAVPYLVLSKQRLHAYLYR